MSSPTAQQLAEAAAKRNANSNTDASPGDLMQEHEKRQTFRRMIDPGIFRPNARQVAMESLKTLSKMADNILREPDNPKYQTFKRENDTIKRRLVEPKGALEYALALGFSPKVVKFESHYVFNPAKMDDLRVGAAILKEALDRETDKEERAQKAKVERKAAEAAVTQNVMLAYYDDRRRKELNDARERELREARGSRPRNGSAPVAMSPLPSPEPEESPVLMPGIGHTLTAVDNPGVSPVPMPGVGHTLTAVDNPDVDQPPPPPYQDSD